MLSRLARWLRAAGYDTREAAADEADRDILARAVAEGRILLTRDRGLLEHRDAPGTVRLLESADLDGQARELADRHGLDWLHQPFSRCLVCNTPLTAAPGGARQAVPPRARAVAEALWQCPGCGRVYWEGSHVRRMRQRLRAWAGHPAMQ